MSDSYTTIKIVEGQQLVAVLALPMSGTLWTHLVGEISEEYPDSVLAEASESLTVITRPVESDQR